VRKHRGYARASRSVHVAGQMNGTEREFAGMLDVRRAAGEVVCYWYEGVTLKLASDCRYTADFFVLLASGEMEVVEVKGGFVRDDARLKVKLAADRFPFRFTIAHKQPKKLGGGWRYEVVASDVWAERAA